MELAILDARGLARITADQLKNAASSGDEGTVRSLLESDEFGEMDVESLASALEEACKNGHTEVVKVFMQSDRFSKIENWRLGDILRLVARPETKHADIAKLLIPLVDAKVLGEILVSWSAFDPFDPSVVNIPVLIESGRLGDISRQSLNDFLREASEKNRPSDVQDLIDSGRMEEISSFEIGQALNSALWHGYTDVADKLIENTKRTTFRAIDRTLIDRCLRSCRKKGYVSRELAILNAYAPNKSGQTCAVM